MAEAGAITGRGAFIGALGIYTAGGLFWAFLPFFVGLQVGAGGMSQAQAGALGSAYLVGFSLASLTGLWWVPRYDWRILVAGAAAIIVLGLFTLAEVGSYGVNIAAVFTIGVMMGGFWTIAYRIFGAASNPDRGFAIGIVVAYTALALVSYGVGNFIGPEYGLRGCAYLLGGLIVVLGCSALLVPAGDGGWASAPAAISYRPPRRVLLALLGIFATGLAFAGVWAFAERIGAAAGFDSGQVSPVVASNLLASAGGSVLATVLGTRFGRRSTLLVGMVLMMAAVLALYGAHIFWLYATGIIGLGFCVGFVLPYQMGTLAALDVEGRFVVLITAAQGIGSAAGPVIGGLAVDVAGLHWLLIAAMVALGFGIAIFSAITARRES